MNTLILAAAKLQIEDDVFSSKLIYSKSIKICLVRVKRMLLMPQISDMARSTERHFPPCSAGRTIPFALYKSSHLSILVWSRWLDIGLYGSRGLKKYKKCP